MSRLIDECLIVRTDVWVLNRCKDANLIESVLLLFVGELAHLDLLERVDLRVHIPDNVVDATVGALTYRKSIVS